MFSHRQPIDDGLVYPIALALQANKNISVSHVKN